MSLERGAVVRIEREPSGLAVLTLDSPPLNLFDVNMIDDLQSAIEDLSAEPPRALLIRAEGRAVSGGVDVHVFKDLTPEQGSHLWDELLGMIDELERLPAPIVFAAHALTLTAAFEISLACDLIVAARGARFGLVERVVGLTPSMGGTQRLAERAGSGRARQLVMTGDLFGAEELERWGVVNYVFEDEEFEARSRALAEDLARPAALSRGRHPGRRRGDPDRGRGAVRNRGPAGRRPRLPRARRPRPRRVPRPLSRRRPGRVSG
jgi:enoyl-CoA hydratase